MEVSIHLERDVYIINNIASIRRLDIVFFLLCTSFNITFMPIKRNSPSQASYLLEGFGVGTTYFL